MGLANVYELNTPASLAMLHFNDIKDKYATIPDDFPITNGVTYGMKKWQLKNLLNERQATDVATAISAICLELHDKSAISLVVRDVLAKFTHASAMIDDYIEIRRLDVERS